MLPVVNKEPVVCRYKVLKYTVWRRLRKTTETTGHFEVRPSKSITALRVSSYIEEEARTKG